MLRNEFRDLLTTLFRRWVYLICYRHVWFLIKRIRIESADVRLQFAFMRTQWTSHRLRGVLQIVNDHVEENLIGLNLVSEAIDNSFVVFAFCLTPSLVLRIVEAWANKTLKHRIGVIRAENQTFVFGIASIHGPDRFSFIFDMWITSVHFFVHWSFFQL